MAADTAARIRLVSEAAKPHPVAKLPLFTTSDLFARFADRLVIAFLPAATLFLPAPRSNPAATPAAAAMNLAESTLEYTFRRRVPLAAAGGAR